jgi:RNA polymerase sigma-70 factor (ECF subfamily)
MDFLPESLKDGDAKAWDDVLSMLDPLVRSVVCWSRWHFSADIQEELAQDIRTGLLKALPKFKGDANLQYYVKRICVNRCVDQVRRQVMERKIFDAEAELDDVSTAPASQDFDPIERILSAERFAALATLLQELDPTCDKAIRLFYSEGQPYKEMAQVLGITVKTVSSRLSKCLRKLRQLIKTKPLLWEYFGRPPD